MSSSEDRINASALLLLEDTLSEIDTYDGANFKKLFDHFKEAYLDKLYPEGQVAVNPRVQQIIIKHLSKWLCARKSLVMNDTNLPILKKALASGLKLPYDYFGSIKSCLSVLKNWLFIEADPQALCDTDVYIEMIMELFDKRPYIGFQNEQVDSYQEGIYFFRSLLCSNSEEIDLDKKKLQTMLKLLEVGEFLFTSDDLIVSKGLEIDIGRLYGETLWFCLAKSGLKSRSLFERVSVSVQLMNNSQVISEWSKCINNIIDAWANKKYNVKFEIGEKGLVLSNNGGEINEMFSNDQEKDLLFSWKNISRAIGDIFSFKSQAYEEAAFTFARFTDKLLRLNTNLASEYIPILTRIAANNVLLQVP